MSVLSLTLSPSSRVGEVVDMTPHNAMLLLHVLTLIADSITIRFLNRNNITIGFLSVITLNRRLEIYEWVNLKEHSSVQSLSSLRQGHLLNPGLHYHRGTRRIEVSFHAGHFFSRDEHLVV